MTDRLQPVQWAVGRALEADARKTTCAKVSDAGPRIVPIFIDVARHPPRHLWGLSLLNRNTASGDEIVRGNAVAGRATALREAVALTVAPRPVDLRCLAVARNPSLPLCLRDRSRHIVSPDLRGRLLKSTGW